MYKGQMKFFKFYKNNNMHNEYVTVWCVTIYDRVVGPYFFENEAGLSNRERYRIMLNMFLRQAVLFVCVMAMSCGFNTMELSDCNPGLAPGNV